MNIFYLNNETIHWQEVEACEGLPNQIINSKSERAAANTKKMEKSNYNLPSKKKKKISPNGWSCRQMLKLLSYAGCE